ncbi:MAG: hypothetical protein QOK05_2494 [Chloroflexota bacterium]|jgi:hypothetical protein|nr:hypothetical protein [Chloroflexota bacterium]
MSAVARHAGLLLAAAYVLLGAAWLGANPPATGPDEPEHYLWALSIGQGDFLGSATTDIPMRPQNPGQAHHLLRTTRSVAVPAGLSVPQSWFCTVLDHDASARCLDAAAPDPLPTHQSTYEARYLPYVYAPVGLVMRLAHSASAALALGRVANFAMSFSLLVLAVLLLWDRRVPASLLGGILALTPTVVFVGTVISPSGPELAASAATLAFLLRLTREEPPPRWAWPLGIAAEGVLCLARPLGPIWLVVLVLCVALLNGRSRLVARLRSGKPWPAVGAGCIVAATILSLGWELIVLPPETRDLSQLWGYLGPSVAAVPEAFGEAIGVFGWQDTLMPRPAYAAWGIAMLLVVAPALLRGRHRERRGLDLVIVMVGTAIVVVSAAVELPTGFAVQGRHVLPIIMAMLMVSGEILYRNRGTRISAPTLGRLGAASGGMVAAVQWLGWYSNAHRYAVGTAGPWWFLGTADWSPAGGWLPWAAFALVAAVVMFLVALSSGREAT